LSRDDILLDMNSTEVRYINGIEANAENRETKPEYQNAHVEQPEKEKLMVKYSSGSCKIVMREHFVKFFHNINCPTQTLHFRCIKCVRL